MPFRSERIECSEANLQLQNNKQPLSAQEHLFEVNKVKKACHLAIVGSLLNSIIKEMKTKQKELFRKRTEL